MSAAIPVPKSLSLSQESRSLNWDIFKQKWSNYELATNLRSKPEEQRTATLLSIIGDEALMVYNAFTWQPQEPKTVENILLKFEAYCKPKLNVSYERFVFMNRKQRADETVEDFVISLRNLSRNCGYAQLQDSLIRDAFVMGIRNKKTQECLLRENNPSLDDAINIARAIERAQQHTTYINKDNEVEPMEIDKIKNERKNNKVQCKFCGYQHVPRRESCPSFGKQCNNCGGKNHFRNVCKKSGAKQEVKEISESDEEFKIE